MTASIPPGWYDDPSAPTMERWWDGSQWTESTRPRTAGPPPPPGVPGAPAGPGGPAGPFAPYPGQPAPGGENRRRNIILAVIAVLVVGGIVATLVVTLGGGDGKGGAAVAGRVRDPDTGVSIPRFKNWVVQDKEYPTDQVLNPFPCPADSSDPPTTDPSDDPDFTSSSDDPDIFGASPTADPYGDDSDSSDDSTDTDCGTAMVSVTQFPGSDFNALVDKLKQKTGNPTASDDAVRSAKLIKDTTTTIDGKKAHVLRWSADVDARETGYDGQKAYLQYVLIDAPDDGFYPVVLTVMDAGSKGPGTGTLDAVINGIKVGPTGSATPSAGPL